MDLVTEHVKWDRKHVSTWTPYHENGQVYKTFKTGFKTVPEMFEALRKRNAGRELLVDEAGSRLTYDQTFDAAATLARALLAKDFSGLNKGDKVAVCSRNSFDWVITYLAAALAGMMVIPMNSWWTTREIEYAVKHAEVKLIFADAERIQRIQQIQTEFPARVVLITDAPTPQILGGRVKVDRLEDFKAKGASLGNAQLDLKLDTDEPAMMMFTSGTTNFPKGVVLTHRGITHTMNMYDKLIALGASVRGGGSPLPEAVLLSVPLFHATGLYAIFLNALLSGRKVVIMRKWNAEKALELIERERVTHFTGVPTMVLEMLSSPDLKKRDVSTLKMLASGGAPPPAGVAKSVKERIGASPSQGYGLTEVNAVATMIGAKDYLKRPTSCGRPVPGVEIRIWSETEDNVEMPVGESGRIVIRGESLMLEYYKDKEATMKAITKDGWFKCGDYGYMDKDGFLYISGRSQDLIIRGGENISARTVEEAVFATFAESIQECAVFGYPHPTLGEEVGLAIHMKPGMEPPTLEEIRKRVSTQVSQFMLPTGLTVFKKTTLPRGATGKTVKKDIKEMLKNNTLENWVTISSQPKAKL